MNEERTLITLIEEALQKAADDHQTREMALVKTKLQEAKMWVAEHQKSCMAAVRRTGFGQPQP